jgi:hypothetical protein
MQCWVNGKKGVLTIKLKMDNILLITSIPVFHHSIIPRSLQELRRIKIPYIFIKLYKFRDVISGAEV